MAVPKKRTSRSKKRIRKNIWKRKAYRSTSKALTLGYSLCSSKSKSFLPHITLQISKKFLSDRALYKN
uniref:Large ribosomal subunit protein bL32c n=1 Tax=Cyphia banksiana TaxID=2041113 RepID=A0A291F2W8_9ASTR|nr:ribosomal protein L32 [Cyphia banksiana]ATG26457.1 ribosomal protein L32 [Cyphia banksiana]